MQFRWIDWNRDHIAKHGVTEEEAEMIVRNARAPFPRKQGDGKWVVIGRGIGGRFVQVVHLVDPDKTIFVIHARPISEREKETLAKAGETMKQAKKSKPSWEMTTEELEEAAKEFDEEFVFEKTRPLTPEEQALWEEVKAKGEPPANGKAEAHIAVRIDKTLLKRCTALAKKKRLSRDDLIARGLRALLAAEGE